MIFSGKECLKETHCGKDNPRRLVLKFTGSVWVGIGLYSDRNFPRIQNVQLDSLIVWALFLSCISDIMKYIKHAYLWSGGANLWYSLMLKFSLYSFSVNYLAAFGSYTGFCKHRQITDVLRIFIIKVRILPLVDRFRRSIIKISICTLYLELTLLR